MSVLFAITLSYGLQQNQSSKALDTLLCQINQKGRINVPPSSIYSWSTSHILEHEFFCFGRLGNQNSRGTKVDFRFSEQLFKVVFFIFCGQNKCLIKFRTISANYLLPCSFQVRKCEGTIPFDEYLHPATTAFPFASY